MTNRISDKVYNLCRANVTVSSELQRNPHTSPGEIAKQLYGTNHLSHHESKPPKERTPATVQDLERAYECGRFGTNKPSELFLRAFHDILCTLEHDPLNGVCSPPLLGSTGVVPFTVVGPLNDILRHMSNLIVRAKSEVFLATNYWMASGGSRLITDAIRELSRRAGQRGEKAVVKLMYDRGNIKQFVDHHQPVGDAEASGKNVELPPARDIPNVDLQVINFHQPLLGTFHSKFMTVDREIAIICSNNIQDNDNTEMMAQLEGPVVDSIMDTFLISWHNALKPPLVCHTPAANKPLPTFQDESFMRLFDGNGAFRFPERAQTPSPQNRLEEHVGGDPHYDDSIAAEIVRMQSVLSPQTPEETQPEIVARHLNKPTKLSVKATAPPPTSQALNYFPYVPTPPIAPFPIAMANRKPYGAPKHDSVFVPQNEAFLSLIRNCQHNIFIQTPDLNAVPLLPAIVEAVKRGIQVTYYVCLGYNDAGELLPGQGGTNEMVANSLYSQLSTPEEKDRLRVHYYVAKDQDAPIHNSFKQRSCHIKLLIADAHVAIQGSGNQDTQTWFQSQEVNVMIDSAETCKSWREAIERNQNTAQYGRASSEDGCWHDAAGNLAKGSIGNDPGHFAWAKGIVGAVNRARGAGGF